MYCFTLVGVFCFVIFFFNQSFKVSDLNFRIWHFGGNIMNFMAKTLLAYTQYFFLTLLYGLWIWSRYTPYSRFWTLSVQTLGRQMQGERSVNHFWRFQKGNWKINLIICSKIQLKFKFKLTIHEYLTCVHKLGTRKWSPRARPIVTNLLNSDFKGSLWCGRTVFICHEIQKKSVFIWYFILLVPF